MIIEVGRIVNATGGGKTFSIRCIQEESESLSDSIIEMQKIKSVVIDYLRVSPGEEVLQIVKGSDEVGCYGL